MVTQAYSFSTRGAEAGGYFSAVSPGTHEQTTDNPENPAATLLLNGSHPACAFFSNQCA